MLPNSIICVLLSAITQFGDFSLLFEALLYLYSRFQTKHLSPAKSSRLLFKTDFCGSALGGLINRHPGRAA